MNEYEALVALYRKGKPEVLGEKPVPAPLHPPQISRGLALNQPWICTVTI
jgi:hypothetical protein